MEQKLNSKTRDQMCLLLANSFARNYTDMSGHELVESIEYMFINGVKGYKDLSCDELLADFHDSFMGYEDDEIDENVLEVYKEAVAQIEIYDHINNEDVPF